MRITNSAINYVSGQPLVDADMYSSDQTLTAGQNFTTAGTALRTNGADSVSLMFKFTGANASSSGTVDFYIAGSQDGTNFETSGTKFSWSLNGNSAVRRLGVMDTRNIPYIRVVRIVNGDATYGLSSVNVRAYSLQ